MYNPAYFQISNPEALRRILCEHPLGMLVTHGPEGLDANHLPFVYDPTRGEQGTLTAHVARANPVWQQCAAGAEVLVVFRGEAGYVSPNWYPSKHEAHRQVPTWNYEVVHVHGRLTVHDDDKFVRGVVARLTRTHEAAEPQPWQMGDAPPDYLNAMLQAIVGIEITVTRLEGKAKLSQNKTLQDQQGAVNALQARGREGLAQAMARQISR